MKRIKKTKIQYQYTYTILYNLQLIIIALTVLIVGIHIFSRIAHSTILSIKDIFEFSLSYIIISAPLLSSLGLLIDFLVLKKRKHIILVSMFIVLLTLFFLFAFFR